MRLQDVGSASVVETQTEKPTPKGSVFQFWCLPRESSSTPSNSGLRDFRHSLNYAFTIAFAPKHARCCAYVSPILTLSHTQLPTVWHSFYESARK